MNKGYLSELRQRAMKENSTIECRKAFVEQCHKMGRIPYSENMLICSKNIMWIRLLNQPNPSRISESNGPIPQRSELKKFHQYVVSHERLKFVRSDPKGRFTIVKWSEGERYILLDVPSDSSIDQTTVSRIYLNHSCTYYDLFALWISLKEKFPHVYFADDAWILTPEELFKVYIEPILTAGMNDMDDFVCISAEIALLEFESLLSLFREEN